MTREQLMEELYSKNTWVTAGDIALALSKRFPKCQGNRTLKDGTETKSHFEMANEFLLKKRHERHLEAIRKPQKKTPQEIHNTMYEFRGHAMRIAKKWADEMGREFRAIISSNMNTNRR